MSAKRKHLSGAEVSVIKGLLRDNPELTNQDILSKFSVPMRTINPGRISEIKNGHPRYANIPPASKDEVDKFLSGKTKLHDLAGELFSMKGTPQVAFGEIEYDPHTRDVSTPESASLDYKVGYEHNSLLAYLKILAGMANTGKNTGSIVFGISDNPRRIVGVTSNWAIPDSHGRSQRPPRGGDGSSNLDIPDFLKSKWRHGTKNYFEPFFHVDLTAESIGGDGPTIVRAQLADVPPRPIICRKTKSALENGSDKELLREAAIYYRYGTSTEEILYAELRILIDRLKKGG